MANNRITLTNEQREYLIRCYPDTKNDVLMSNLSLKYSTFHRFVRNLGLKKTGRFMKDAQRGAAEAASRYFRVTRCRRPKKKLPQHLEQYKFKPGEKPWTKCGKERWRAGIDRGIIKRKATFREEKVRKNWGLEQRTKLRVVSIPRKKILDRSYLKKRGYIIDEDNQIAYWNSSTKRAIRLEAMPKRYYEFRQLPEQ